MASFTILEPISTGDVIDRAVRLYRRNFTPLVAITAVPSLIGYLVSIVFWSGYGSLIASATQVRGVPESAILMLVSGSLGYPIWAYVLLLTVSGLSRVVGDHLMLNEPITFRGCFAAARRRLGDITLMGLILIMMLIAAYIVVSIAAFVLILAVSLIVGIIAAANVPQWLSTTIFVVLLVVAVAAALLVISVVASRIVFLPQVVMIEGQSAGNAIGRAMRLGKGNWYRVAAIALFTYFVSTSLLAAFSLPVLAALYFAGVLTPEFFFSPVWSILSASFGQISNLLSLPIWIVSFTLLYFDSRVRKEAYDLDLIAREINPGFNWESMQQPSVPGYPAPRQFAAREYLQTSPLGLSGYRPQPRQTPVNFEGESSEEHQSPETSSTGSAAPGGIKCKECGSPLLDGASFCITCGRVSE